MIPLIADTAVLLAYARLDLGVGEMIGEVVDGGGRLGIPVLTAAAALCQLADEDDAKRLADLLGSAAIETLPVGTSEGPALGRHARRLDADLALAQVVIEAARHDALIYTGSGQLLRDQYGDIGIVDLD